MMRRRDVVVAACTLVVSLAIATAGRSADAVMGSTAFEWTKLPAKPTKVGEVRQVFQAPTATLDELECHITTLEPGQTPHAPHRHPDEEIIIIKEGTVESLLGDRTERVGPGSIIFQASNQLHSIRNVGTTRATYHVIKWNSPGMLKKKP
jgi:quercetin dioxygenase-like cupin family protein